MLTSGLKDASAYFLTFFLSPQRYAVDNILSCIHERHDNLKFKQKKSYMLYNILINYMIYKSLAN